MEEGGKEGPLNASTRRVGRRKLKFVVWGRGKEKERSRVGTREGGSCGAIDYARVGKKKKRECKTLSEKNKKGEQKTGLVGGEGPFFLRRDR